MQLPAPLVARSTMFKSQLRLCWLLVEGEELDQEDALDQFSSGAAPKVEPVSVQDIYIHI